MKNIGIYDPYFSILGGAERYILDIANCLKSQGRIILFGVKTADIDKARKKFGLDIRMLTAAPWENTRLRRFKTLQKLDVFIYVSDGSIFLSPAKKNILIVQTPDHIPAKSLANTVKLLCWYKILVYSQYMRNIVKKRLHKKSEILFVPVSSLQSLLVEKERIILSVGRFYPNLHNKKQLEMVAIFKELVATGLVNTRLYLVGSIDPGGEDYFNEVKKAASGLPIEILVDATYSELIDLYKRAKIYWHATGYKEDLIRNPERAEHFGVVTLEAMSYGCVPIVFAGGGQIELVTHGQNGFLWLKKEELMLYTHELFSNEQKYQMLSTNAKKHTDNYSTEKFCESLYAILQN